ncbi:MAG TPA: tripartite tricarboxylate transporter substrate binding protein [Alphaproteobacteria bacterium]|nr:tripartite tricarboxylate transporter substrate binding protein [Alphaproteobacteria bacterium]
MRALFVAAALLSAASGAHAAETWPVRPVHIIVPFAPAGPTDAVSRVLADKLGNSLGQQFVVENRPGAGANIGIDLVAHAAPDGYTVLMVSSSFVINPSSYHNPGYDPFKDFAPVTDAGSSPNIIVTNPSLPAKTMKELVALVHANPGKYSYAVPGIGTLGDLSARILLTSLKLDMVPVAFNGAGPAMTSVIQGQTPIGFASITPAIPQVKAGALRGLAVASEKRLASLADVPTLAEAGYPAHEAGIMHAVLFPAHTPNGIVDRLYREIAKAVALPDVQQRFETLGFQPKANTPAEFAAEIKAEVARWAKVIKDAHLPVQ